MTRKPLQFSFHISPLEIGHFVRIVKGPNAMGIWQVIFLLGCSGMYSTEIAPKKPHILFMIVDDLGWNDVSFHGSKQIPTPNVDAIARDGIILNQYYVQPACSPSRGSLMTGKYSIRIGFQHNLIRANEPWGLPLKERTMPQYLKSLKYATHAVGKWHLGYFKEEYLPLHRGFDSFFGYYSGVEDYFTHFSNIPKNTTGLDLHQNLKNEWRYNGTYGTELFTAKAKRIIEKHDPTQPLFLYFAQQAPHSGNFNTEIVQAPEKYVRPMVGIEDEKRKIFAGMVSAMDHSVGEIFAALEKSKMLDDTIFIFTTDNGGAPQELLDGTSGSNWPLKGCKHTLWEGGVRGVSFVWSSLLRQSSRIYNGMMHISDWLPTVLSAAGGPEALKMLPKDIDGVDQWPSLVLSLPSRRPEILLNIDGDDGMRSLRRGKFKLIKGTINNGRFDKWYDQEGKIFGVNPHSIQTPVQKMMYEKNYAQFLKHSKAAGVLWEKYGKDRQLTSSCITEYCKQQLEVNCGVLFPTTSTCDAQKEPCLYDLVNDPCEYHNIAKQFPEVTAALDLAMEQYKILAIPPGNKPADPKSDPKLHGNAWVPWK